MIRFFSILIIYINSSFFCIGQKTIKYNNLQWAQYYNQLKISKKISILSDCSIRSMDSFSQWQQMLIRTGVSYKLIDNIQGTTGAGCFVSFSNNKPSRVELRPYQDFSSSHLLNNISVQHRFRTEARYFRNIKDGIISKTSNFNFRLRYRFFCEIPLISFSKDSTEKNIMLNIGNEIFVNVGKEIVYNILDNNRLLIGIAMKANKKLSISLTYAYQFGQRNSPNLYEHSDILWLGIIHKVSLIKKT